MLGPDKRPALKNGGVSMVTKPEGEEFSGYMLKYSKSASGESSSGWKKRFFVLRGSTLNYFSDQYSTKSKGELLIFAETQIKSANENGQPFCISLWEPFSLLQLATASAADLTMWMQAFTRAIDIGRKALRSVMYRKAQLVDGGTKKKFFILHSDVITYHKDREQLLNVQGLVHLDRNTDMEYNDTKLTLTVQDMSANYGLSMQFKPNGGPEAGVYEEWKNALQEILLKYNVSTRDAEATSSLVRKDKGMILMEGPMQMRLSPPSETWVEYMFYLTDAELLVVDLAAERDKQLVESLKITSNSGVFETNLGQYAFEVVTPSKVLHAMPLSDPGLAVQWVAAIKGVIERAYLDTDDPLLQSAILQIDDDEFLTITITEKKPLGITFERANEWAIVKSTKGEGGIPIGAALTEIDNKSCILSTYSQTIELLKTWMPPLTLRFRLPPSKFGYLLKESRSKRDPTRTVWKKRFFILGSGRLCYKETADPESSIKGEFPLLGSAVSLVSAQEIGRFFCLRLISGVATLLLQSATERQMLEWASNLYHAIAIANGGGHILNYERDRLLLNEGDMNDIEERDDPQLSASDALMQAKSLTPTTGSPQYLEALESLTAAMANARYDHLFTLVESIEFAKRAGVDCTEATVLLGQLQLRKQAAEGAMFRVNEAGTARDRNALAAAISEAEELGLLRELDPARTLFSQLVLQEAEDALLAATKKATTDTIPELTAAIERAKASHVSVAKVVDAQAVAITLRKRRAEMDECIANLHTATQSRSAARIESTLQAATRLGLENHIAALMADQVLAQIKQEGLERDLDEAVRSATCVDTTLLQRTLARAEVECDPDYPLAPHLVSTAHDRLRVLLELQSLRVTLLSRLARAVDVEIANDIEEVLTAIDATEEINENRALLADEPHVMAAREILLRLREDERLVQFWKEAEEKARAEELIKVRLAQEEALERERQLADKRHKIDLLVQEVLKASAASDIHSLAQLRDSVSRLAGMLHSTAHGSDTAADLEVETSTATTALSNAQALVDILVTEKSQYDLSLLALNKALQSMTIAALSSAVTDADSKCAQFGFTLGEEHNTARYELSRLKREEAEAVEREKLRLRQLEMEERQRKTAAEAAKRALLDEEERLRQEMEEREAIYREVSEKLTTANAALDVAMLAALKEGGVSAGARSIESHDFHIQTLEDAILQAQQAQQVAEEGSDRHKDSLPLLSSSLERAIEALRQHKASRATFRISLASQSATIDDFNFLDSVLSSENAADEPLIDPSVREMALQRLADLKAQRQTRSQAQQMLSEALESGSMEKLEHSLRYSEQVGYSSLTAAVAASSMLAAKKKTAVEEEIDAAMAASHVGDFDKLEDLLARVEEQKSLGVDAGKVLLMKQKLRELSQRRKEQDSCLAALRNFLDGNAATASNLVVSESQLPDLAASITQLQTLLTQAETLGLGSDAGGDEMTRELVESSRAMLHSLRSLETSSQLLHCIDATFELSGIDTLVKLVEQGQRLKIAATLLQQGNVLLDALVNTKMWRKSALEGIERAVANTEPSISALEGALEIVNSDHKFDMSAIDASSPAAKTIAMIGPAAALTEDKFPVIRQAKMMLSTLKTKRASEALATALSVSTVEECESLEQALELSQGVLGQDDELYASAREKLNQIKELQQTRQLAAKAVEAAISSGGVPQLEEAIALAEACGLAGDFIDGAKSLLFMLNQVAADVELSEAMESAQPEDTSALEAAISRAEKVYLDEYKVSHALELLQRMRLDKAARDDALRALREAIESQPQTLAALEAALQLASTIENRTNLPPLLEELTDIASNYIRQIKSNKEKARLLSDVKDSMRLRNSASIRKTVDAALAAGVASSDPIISQADAMLLALADKAVREQEEEKRDEEARRQRALDAELALQAAAAQAAAAKLAQRASQPDTVASKLKSFDDDDDDDEDGDLNDERERETNMPRKLARRKSKRYSFSHTVKASRDQLHKVFVNYGGAARPGGVDEEEVPGFINAMQFSTIWRLITEEKGNLFKEMQMFKKFDRSGEGVLREDDFIDGWSKLAEEGAGGYSGEHLLSRIAALADPLSLPDEDEDEEDDGKESEVCSSLVGRVGDAV